MTKAKNQLNARSLTKSGDTWTMADPSRIFAMGGHIIGPRTTMFKLATGSACIDVLAQDVSKTPCYLRRRIKTGSEVVKPAEHPAADLITNKPNPFFDMNKFIKVMVTNLAIDSEYYVAARRDRNGKALELVGIPKNCVGSKDVNPKNRKLYYNIQPSSRFDEAVFGWIKGKVESEDVAHISRRSFDGLTTLSTAGISGDALGLLSSMKSQQKDFFDGGGVPNMAFTFPEGLTDEQFHRLKDGLEKSIAKSKKDGTPIVLEGAGGVVPQIQNLSQTAADQEFVKNATAASMDVVRYFRVPPHKVFLLESVKYENMDSAERTYVDDTLCSYFIDIEGALNHALLTDEERKEYYFEFDKEAAYAMSPTDRQKIVEGRWTHGLVTKNEARHALGYNQLGESGDVYMSSGNFVLTTSENEVIMRAGGNSPDDENEPNKDDDDKKSEKKSYPRLVK